MIKTVETKTIDYGKHKYGEYDANVEVSRYDNYAIFLDVQDQVIEVEGIRKLANDLLQVADILNKENNIG